MLANPIPLSGPVGLRGGGLAAWYNMRMSDTARLDAVKVANTTKDVSENTSGSKFVPDDKVSFGFNIMAILQNNASDRVFNGDAAISAQFTDADGMSYLQFDGSAFVGSSIIQRDKAPIKGAMRVHYDFVKEIFDLNVKVDIRNPLIGPAMFKTKEPATLNLYVDLKNKINNEPKWRLTVGTPEAPNQFILYEVLNTWSYFRAGNDLVTNTSFQPATLEGLKSVDPSFSAMPSSDVENAKGGKGFDFGIGFNEKGGVEVGPFSGSFNVGAELNLSMEQFGPDNGCATDKFNYWYARGGVAAWASAELNFKKLVGVKLKAAAIMQAGAPDPLWAKGRVAGTYTIKILFISININASVPFSTGNLCKPKRTLTESSLVNQDALEINANDLVEIGDFATHKSGATDRLTAVELVSLFGCKYGNTTYQNTISVLENDVMVEKSYTVQLEWYVTGNIIKNPGSGGGFPGSPSYIDGTHDMLTKNGLMKQEGSGYLLGTFLENGSPRSNRYNYNTFYSTWVIATLKVKNANGEWEDAKNKNGEVIKKTTSKVNFTTHRK
jgi:hypothetical protein